LLTSLLSAASRSARGAGSRPAINTTAAPLPVLSDRWPTLLRASIVAVAGGATCAITVWSGHVRESGGDLTIFVSAVLLAAGVGVLAGCRPKRSGVRSIGGFGVACAAAGALIAVSTLGLTATSGAGLGAITVAVCLCLAATGFATAYGRQALLSRVANRSFAGATVLARMLGCAAFMVWIGVPLAERLIGRPATLVFLALSLLALGGGLIIQEPSYSRRTRRLRLCAVFGSIGLMIILSLAPGGAGRRIGGHGRAETGPVSARAAHDAETRYSALEDLTDP
jgi:hypothetical protein